jgi:MerR family mercuric resistance operon transcriptional regulator
MTMTIGRLAKAAGVNVETVRYYQRRGLLREPRKPAGGQRRYAEDVLRRIGFIRRAQQLGFTLDEIGQLMPGPHGPTCRDARRVAEQRYAVIESRLAELERMRSELGRLIAACRRSRSACPLIDALLEEA